MRRILTTSLAAVMALAAGTAANATRVDVSFSGTFDGGETFTGSFWYDTDAQINGTTYYGLLKDYTLTSSLIEAVTGGTTFGGSQSLVYGNYIQPVPDPTGTFFDYINVFASVAYSHSFNFQPRYPTGTLTQALPTYLPPVSAPFTLRAYYDFPDEVTSANGYFFGAPGTITSFSWGTAGAAAVPEPATWLTMMLGFGLLGVALRRRRVLAIAA